MALIDGISRRSMQGLALIALKDARTMAAERVFEPHPWPTTPEHFPLLMVQVPVDRKTGVMPGQLEFDATLTMIVTGRVNGGTPEDVNLTLDRLEEQILDAIMFDRRVTRQVQQFVSIATNAVVSAEGRGYRGEIVISFDLATFQVYGDIRAEPLREVRGTLTDEVSGKELAETGVSVLAEER